MALETDIITLLTKLTSSLDSAKSSLPDAKSAVPSPDGISLLDVKTDLFLSYLQNLTFLILLKLRNYKANAGTTERTDVDPDEGKISNDKLVSDVVKKLVELRVYLEKGVRPLESRLKYQIDKVLNAADTAARRSVGKANGQTNGKKHRPSLPKNLDNPSDTPSSASSSAASDEDDNSDNENKNALSYRPNPAAFTRPSNSSANLQHPTKPNASKTIYRPPRITPTAPPQLPSTAAERNNARRNPAAAHRAAMDDFIAAELSSAPRAEPSIGSTIVDRGRRSRSARELAAEAERRAYEEANYTRLPGAGKKERQQQRADAGGAAAGGLGFGGGDELRGIGEGVERIARVTGKRGRETVDGPRGEGFDGGYRGERGKKRRFAKGR